MREALSELRWLDALDVLLVAALLYGGIAWLRRSQAALVALGIGLLAGVWALARALELELVCRAFEALSAALLVVLVVVFQEELRQAFEHLAAWILGRRHHVQPRLDTTQVLVESLERLAARRMGALVVIPGMQSVRRHVNGGVELGGKLSAPLVESLFDPHTPGHDGAAIVENRSISAFGVQLPLSRRAAPRAEFGTRHGAALGLSELTDALCLVVSEERGTVSAAQGGELRALAGPGEIAAAIDAFFRSHLPIVQKRSWHERLLGEHRAEKLAALGLAAALWVLFVPGSRTVELTLQVPVEVRDLPSHLDRVRVDPSRVRATLEGSRRDFLLLDTGDLKFQLDGALAAQGRRSFHLSAANLAGGAGIAVRDLHPETIRISVGGQGGD
jgi:uncharacterized protein (TIGR00159 family)